MIIGRVRGYYMYLHMTKMKILWIFGTQTLVENTYNLLINYSRKLFKMLKIMKGFVIKCSLFGMVLIGWQLSAAISMNYVVKIESNINLLIVLYLNQLVRRPFFWILCMMWTYMLYSPYFKKTSFIIIKLWNSLIFLSRLLGLRNQIISRQIWFIKSIMSKVLESGSWRNLKTFLLLIKTPSTWEMWK